MLAECFLFGRLHDQLGNAKAGDDNHVVMGVRDRGLDPAEHQGSIVDLPVFELGFEENFAAIHGYVARRVGVPLADDLAAETFATAFRRRATFDPARGSLRSWLYGIATNLLRNHWRSEQHLLELDSRLRAETEIREGPLLSDERLSASLIAPRIAAALATLAGEQRVRPPTRRLGGAEPRGDRRSAGPFARHGAVAAVKGTCGSSRRAAGVRLRPVAFKDAIPPTREGTDYE